jgi:hypothetical protein
MIQKLTVISEDFLEAINEKQDKIISLLQDGNLGSQNDFITENEAKELLHKKSTWFWQMRKDKILPFEKLASLFIIQKKKLINY